jgi:hypothetical protein
MALYIANIYMLNDNSWSVHLTVGSCSLLFRPMAISDLARRATDAPAQVDYIDCRIILLRGPSIKYVCKKMTVLTLPLHTF